MPQLSEIRFFVAAAENGSLRRAAETLGVGQSCVSRKIMRLEEKLGVSLLERSNTGVRLTNAGQRYLEEVQPALQQLDQARRAAHSAGRADVGSVQIGVLTSLAGGFLRKLIVAYQQEYPQVRITSLLFVCVNSTSFSFRASANPGTANAPSSGRNPSTSLCRRVTGLPTEARLDGRMSVARSSSQARWRQVRNSMTACYGVSKAFPFMPRSSPGAWVSRR